MMKRTIPKGLGASRLRHGGKGIAHVLGQVCRRVARIVGGRDDMGGEVQQQRFADCEPHGDVVEAFTGVHRGGGHGDVSCSGADQWRAYADWGETAPAIPIEDLRFTAHMRRRSCSPSPEAARQAA